MVYDKPVRNGKERFCSRCGKTHQRGVTIVVGNGWRRVWHYLCFRCVEAVKDNP